jgi:hypothetical protein
MQRLPFDSAACFIAPDSGSNRLIFIFFLKELGFQYKNRKNYYDFLILLTAALQLYHDLAGQKYDRDDGDVCREMLRCAVRIYDPLVRDFLHSCDFISGKLF